MLKWWAGNGGNSKADRIVRSHDAGTAMMAIAGLAGPARRPASPSFPVDGAAVFVSTQGPIAGRCHVLCGRLAAELPVSSASDGAHVRFRGVAEIGTDQSRIVNDANDPTQT